MDANILAQSRSSTICLAQWKLKGKRKQPCVVGVLTTPTTGEAAKTNVYKDSWFDHLAINHLSKSVQAATGLSNSKSGYESLVEASTMASKEFNHIQQQQLVIQALDKAFPRPILLLVTSLVFSAEMLEFIVGVGLFVLFSLGMLLCMNEQGQIRTLLPPSKFAREYFAVFTTLFFAWLVGPSEVRESEINGRREKNVVHIKKCRFLEEANCIGMCINLCKMPSQSFVKDSLGMPVNMVPNFEDMSCDMIFGQDPPASNDDPTLKQPCYKLCFFKPARSGGNNITRVSPINHLSLSLISRTVKWFNTTISL
ncbi:unnamed protein product [Lupinus luteus]|uniref:Beta-carotene isomerase D27-like C-terminal domain-containing protein n=1 Tax=Lupinus luteus TaxID=3873 RepID=A0AAV1XGT9_LUPLU